jgi:two-component system, chemotaxis family, chemotaxis protein CheY
MAKIPFERMSFAVVEDNIHMRRLIRTLLYSFGSREIYEAEDGASGLEAVEMYSPDILITDWMMPIFDGLEFIQMIRNPEGCSNAYIPIIMLTGHCERKRVTLARDAGVTEFLCKPFSAKSLYERIEHIILNPRPFVRTSSYFGPQKRKVQMGMNAQNRSKKSGKGSLGHLEESDDSVDLANHV